MTISFLQKFQRQNQAGRYACAGLDPVEAQMGKGLWRPQLYQLIGSARTEAAAT